MNSSTFTRLKKSWKIWQIRNLAIFRGLLKLNDDCSTFPTITINSMLQSFQRVDSQGDLKIYDPIRLESVIASQLLDYLTFSTFCITTFQTVQLCVQPQQIPLLFSVASYLALKGTIFMSVLLNNRFLRERGMTSTPKMENQVFLFIFQRNSAMARYLRFEGNGKISLGRQEKKSALLAVSVQLC